MSSKWMAGLLAVVWWVFAPAVLAEEALQGGATNSASAATAAQNAPGYLLVSIGASPGTNYYSYTFFYRKKDRSHEDDVKFVQDRSIPFFGRPDFKGKDENGVGAIKLVKLPPGEYEFYNFDVYYANGMSYSHWRSKREFSIPFVIRPGEATYTGYFRAEEISPVRGHFHHEGAYFVLLNQLPRDITFARQTIDPNMKVNIEIGKPEEIRNPFIRAEKIQRFDLGEPIKPEEERAK